MTRYISEIRKICAAHIRGAIAVALAVTSLSAARADDRGGRRQAIWESALQGVHGVSDDVTVRNVARVSVAGSDLRVRLGNPYGTAAVHVRAASIGLQWAPTQPAVVPGSLRGLTFRGKSSVDLPPGEVVYSDPVHLRVGAQQNLVVSLFAPGAPVNDHTFPAPEINPPGVFIAGVPGDQTMDETGAAFPATPVIAGDRSAGWHPGQLLWLDLIDARTEARGTIVTLGDSITDGYNVSGGGDRWTDLLAARIALLPADEQKAIANAGISGNTVSRQPNPYDPTGQCCGAPAPVRLQRDVLSVPGVTDVLLLEGTNDLGGGDAAPASSAGQVIAGIREIVDRVHARKLRIIGATVLPMCNPADSDKEANRQRVNAFIRNSGIFDGVIDWDAAMRDPADPTVIRAEWKNDCYHPNAAGDRVMARAIDLRLFDLSTRR